MLRGFLVQCLNLAIKEKWKLPRNRIASQGLSGLPPLQHPRWQTGTLWEGNPNSSQVHWRAPSKCLLSFTPSHQAGPTSGRPQRSGMRFMRPGSVETEGELLIMPIMLWPEDLKDISSIHWLSLLLVCVAVNVSERKSWYRPRDVYPTLQL